MAGIWDLIKKILPQTDGAMSERLPDGRTVDDLMRTSRRNPSTLTPSPPSTALASGQQIPLAPRPAIVPPAVVPATDTNPPPFVIPEVSARTMPAINVPETAGASAIEPPALALPTPAITPPVVTRAAEQPLGRPPLMTSGGYTVTKPVMGNSGDGRADLADYAADLGNYKNPKDTEGRLKSSAKTGAQTARQVALAGGTPAQILGALIGGSVWGGVSPNANERIARDMELAGIGAQQAAIQGREDAALKRRGLEAGVMGQEIENELKLNPRPKDLTPHYETREDGTYIIDAKSPEGRKLSGVPGKPTAQGRPQTVRLKNADGSEAVYERGADGVWKDTGLKSAGQPRRRVTLGGETFEVPEAEAARILGGIEAANVGAGNKFGEQAFEDERRSAEQTFNRENARWEDANRSVGQLAKALEEVEKAKAIYDHPPPGKDGKVSPEDMKFYESQFNIAKEAAARLSSSITNAYGDMVQHDAKGWPSIVKSRPAMPAVPKRPAPQKRQAQASPRRSTTPKPKSDPLGLFSN